jgi:hypothetical protein
LWSEASIAKRGFHGAMVTADRLWNALGRVADTSQTLHHESDRASFGADGAAIHSTAQREMAMMEMGFHENS